MWRAFCAAFAQVLSRREIMKIAAFLFVCLCFPFRVALGNEATLIRDEFGIACEPEINKDS
jgi:hypothetical protein